MPSAAHTHTRALALLRTCMLLNGALCAATCSQAPARCSTEMLPGVMVLTRRSGYGRGVKVKDCGCGYGKQVGAGWKV